MSRASRSSCVCVHLILRLRFFSHFFGSGLFCRCLLTTNRRSFLFLGVGLFLRQRGEAASHRSCSGTLAKLMKDEELASSQHKGGGPTKAADNAKQNSTSGSVASAPETEISGQCLGSSCREAEENGASPDRDPGQTRAVGLFLLWTVVLR